MIDTGPHEVPSHVVIGADKFLELFHVDVSSAPELEETIRRVARKQLGILASNVSHRVTFGADESPLGKSMAIDAVILLPPVAPPVHIVVAHHVEERQELRAHGVRWGFGCNAVATGSYQTSGVFAVENLEQLSESLRTLRIRLIANLVPCTPEHDGRVIPVAPHQVLYVSLVPLVEVVGVSVGTNLALGHLP